MIEYIAIADGQARLYFSSVEERELFARGLRGVEGVQELIAKENTKTLLVKYTKGSFAHYLITNLKAGKEAQTVGKEDIHFYLAPFLKHPAVKLTFSMLMLGKWVGLVSFGICSMFLIPYLKTKL